MKDYTINVHGRLMDLSEPVVMGILNATPDSFYAGSRVQTDTAIAARAHEIIEQGGRIIDIGTFSTRPNAAEVTAEEEMSRMRRALQIVRRELPEAVISVDTFRPEVAQMSVEEFGADIINDVSEGGITGVANRPLASEAAEYPAMFRMAARLGTPYILMSVRPDLREMLISFAREVQQLRDLGVKDIILDPGYGFGKTLEQNYRLLAEAERLCVMELPILVGISRKSMIYKLLGGNPTTSLNGTTVLNTMFNFVPNAIQLRGESFLWISDLSTYDPIIEWNKNIWLIGDHLSLTCILFCAANVLYSMMTMRQQRDQMVGQQAEQMKMMQWMMYLMPVMFFFMFNDYSSGLNFYYFVSLFFSAAIMWTLRKTTDDRKLLGILEARYQENKNNPKKLGGLAARLQAMQEQQMELQRKRQDLERKRKN